MQNIFMTDKNKMQNPAGNALHLSCRPTYFHVEIDSLKGTPIKAKVASGKHPHPRTPNPPGRGSANPAFLFGPFLCFPRGLKIRRRVLR